jgi:cytochrome c556
MKRAISVIAKGALVAGGLALVTTAVSSTVNANENDIKYRKAVMKALGGHMGSIAGIAKGEIGHTKHMFGHATAINAIAAMTSDIFPKGSGGDNTRAKDDIWQKWSEFEKTISAFQAASEKLLEAANSGDKGAVGAALGGVGKSCGGCHKPFRKPKS